MSKNTNLQAAKNAKQDEFYTRLEDIVKELQHYSHHFKDKVVYCNCDAEWSNFWKYFHDNFHNLGLKKLIATHYEKDSQSHKLEYDGETVIKTELEGDGDFRSNECVEILKEADIVATNPPFSLFRPFIAQLVEHEKKFVVIASMNAITYKEFFPLLKNNEVWLGYNAVKEFTKPDGTTQKFGNICWYTNLDIDKRHKELTLTKNYTPEDYPKYDNYDAIECNKVANIPVDYFPCWYLCDKAVVCEYAQKGGVGNCTACCDTDEEANKCNGIIGVPITFLDKHSPEQFEIVGNLGSYGVDGYSLATAIYVQENKVFKRIAIRRKCNGVIGVPITFLEDYLPEQFEIVGLTSGRDEFECRPIKRYENAQQHNPDGSITSGSKANTRATLPTEDDSSTYYTADNSDEKLKIVYARVLIQRKCNGVIGVPITFLDKHSAEQFELIGHEHDLQGNGSDGVAGGQFEVDGDGVYKRILIQRKCNGMIGVPITFLDKYNPDEFDIVGCSSELAEAVEIDGKTKENPQRFYVDDKRLYDRIIIRKKQE